jgi:hypothetical protein
LFIPIVYYRRRLKTNIEAARGGPGQALGANGYDRCPVHTSQYLPCICCHVVESRGAPVPCFASEADSERWRARTGDWLRAFDMHRTSCRQRTRAGVHATPTPGNCSPCDETHLFTLSSRVGSLSYCARSRWSTIHAVPVLVGS